MGKPPYAPVRAYEKSVVIGGRVLFPLTDPQVVADQVRKIIHDLQDQAYRSGQKDARAAVRKTLGLR